MYKVIYRLLVILAIAAAFAISIHLGLRSLVSRNFIGSHDSYYSIGVTELPIAYACYPFRWQQAQRKRVERQERFFWTPTDLPKSVDSLTLAEYAAYASQLRWESTDYEKVMHEGKRRDPQNALYHYLLAYRWIKLSLEGEYRPKGAPAGTFTYRVKDRPLLDRAMQEMAAGMQLPLDGRRYDLLSAYLDTMPQPRHWEEQVRENTASSTNFFSEYQKIRELAHVNGFYLSLLLAEGRRTKARPFLQTGERLYLQIAADKHPTLPGLEVGSAIHNICYKDAVAVCRQHGLTSDAEDLDRRYRILSGKTDVWRAGERAQFQQQKADPFGHIQRRHASEWAISFLPRYSNLPTPTLAELRPSRMVEYTVLEELAVSLLPLLFVGLLLYSTLKYWRWRWALIGQEVPPHDMRLSAGDWGQILLFGFLLPVGLYALYTALPISGRTYNVATSTVQFYAGIGAFMLWVLIIPATIAAGAIWRRSTDAGLIRVYRPGMSVFMRGFSSVVALVWSAFAALTLVLLPGLLALGLIAISPLHGSEYPLGSPWLEYGWIVLLLVITAFLPVIREHLYTDCAQHFLALSRAMIPVYAVLALCTAALYPALYTLESHYMRQDHLLTTMHTAEIIAPTKAEGRLVLDLQQRVLDGAKQLENEE